MSAERYSELVELAQRELELVRREAYDHLPEVWEERDNLVASLPDTAPEEARAALERAAHLNGRSSAILEERLAVTASELRRLTHGRTAMRGYAPPQAHLPLVDRAG
jgi:predicted Zn-dependent protease with MMP-like domain